MDHAAQLNLTDHDIVAEVYGPRSQDLEDAPSGWWILPFAGLGSLAWVGIFRLVFW